MFKRFVVSGTKKNDNLTGTDRLDVIFGKKGNDVLDGRGGKDFLFGDKGDDTLFGGDGNDFLFGGKGNDKLFGGDGRDFLFGGKGDDFLDGGAGSDYLFGDKGNDTFNFTWSENSGAKDYYDGGKGRDTLQLTLTSAELKLESVQKDIADFEAFLARKGSSHSDDGKVFHFKSFDLNVRDFEALKIEEVGGGNTAPVANPDLGVFVSEDAIDVSIDALANDTDADGDVLTLVATEVTAGLGTAMIVGNQIVYNPGDNYQFLGTNDSANVKIAYSISDGEAAASSFVEIQVNGVNDDPVANPDNFEDLIATRIVSPIKVAVVGGASSSYILASGQLNDSLVFDFDATAIAYTNSRTWADLNVDNYDVVVLGNSGFDDYAGETGSLFTALNTFVGAGGGVVTTGFFASALFGMRDGTNNVDTPLSLAADAITPITSNPVPATVMGAADITVLPPAHPIVDGLASAYVSDAKWHEFAARVNEDEGAVQLATSVVGTNTMTAIAYDGDVGVGHGRTAYLGGTYLANSFFLDLNPDEVGVRTGVLDQIFEQAIAWAAGARGSATVTIDSAEFFREVDDVDSPRSGFTIESFGTPGADGASVAFVDGNIVYTLGAQSLQELEAGTPVTDTFEYTMSDGNDGFATASVSLSIDTLL